MSINMSNDKNIQMDTEAYCEEKAGEEELYLEESEEELRSSLTSDDATAKYWRICREEQELTWEVKISVAKTGGPTAESVDETV